MGVTGMSRSWVYYRLADCPAAVHTAPACANPSSGHLRSWPGAAVQLCEMRMHQPPEIEYNAGQNYLSGPRPLRSPVESFRSTALPAGTVTSTVPATDDAADDTRANPPLSLPKGRPR